MMNPSKHLFPVVAAFLASLPACTSSSSEPGKTSTEESAETGHAQLLLGASGDRPVTITIAAHDEVDGHVEYEKSVDLEASKATSLDIALPGSLYTIEAKVFARGEPARLLGKGSAFASIEAGTSKQIKLLASVTGEEATVDMDVNAAPRIQNVRVSSSEGAIDVNIQASDQDGDPLQYLWSGTGINGVLSGASNLHLPLADQPGAENAKLHVLVVDPHGAVAATTVKILIPPKGAPGMTSKEPPSSCIEAHAGCVTGCDARLGLGLSAAAVLEHSTCEARCNSSLTTCGEP